MPQYNQISDADRVHLKILRGDTTTSTKERQYLMAVEKGDYTSVKFFLEDAAIYFNMDINCIDALGRTAIHIAIENENMDLIDLLLAHKVDIGDALLFAIEEEVTLAVEKLLNYRQPKIRKREAAGMMALQPGQRTRESNYTSDITPVILGAHTNNYEILKLLLQRGATIAKPHPIKCGCYECAESAKFDSLRHSQSRINAFKALASPSLIILSSDDPIWTAFTLSYELRKLSFTEVEFKDDYVILSKQCTKLAVDLLDQIRGSQELKLVLNRTTDPEEVLTMLEAESTTSEFGGSEADVDEKKERMSLSRLRMAIDLEQKEFVAHPSCQQLLSHLFYKGIPGWRQGGLFYKVCIVFGLALAFPFTSLSYIALGPFVPELRTILKNPFIKYVNHCASYFAFIVLLFLTSAEDPSVSGKNYDRERNPYIVEMFIVCYVFSFLVAETQEIMESGFKKYTKNLWNIVDFFQVAAYLSAISLRCVVWFMPSVEPQVTNRGQMSSSDPMLVSESCFAVANVVSILKLLALFISNSELGPLQITLGRMMIDVLKFMFIFFLILLSFASGLNQLLYLEYNAEGARLRTLNCEGVVCKIQNSQFMNMMFSMITLFWSNMGIVDLSAPTVNQDHAFTRMVAISIFVVYHIASIVVLLNMLIAMMNLSYDTIVRNADTEWKFARAKLWISYFQRSGTLPAPFFLLPTVKHLMMLVGWIRKQAIKELQELESRETTMKLNRVMRDNERKYQAVITNLAQLYIANKKKTQDIAPITDDDLNEIKQDISAFRYEVVELINLKRMQEAEVNPQGSLRSVYKTAGGQGAGGGNAKHLRNAISRMPLLKRASSGLAAAVAHLNNDSTPKPDCYLPAIYYDWPKNDPTCMLVQDKQDPLKFKRTFFDPPSKPNAAAPNANKDKVVTAEVLRVPSAGRRVVGGELP
ncbi:short transient receptor potential channel 4-like [Symsagittifera roscoffensis]|uniref:short transient receptor potential channel 4-like n=1 Tax=Symsagittifera roscoffensis TaxID=84072 RepID=UPI00307CA74E